MRGVIADDLTGAAELGAIALRHGLTAEIMSADVLKLLPGSERDVVCVDTHSRSCAPKAAGRRAALAAGAFGALGVRWIYKKVDSVLRGPILPELAAVMKQLGLARSLLVPANPSLGRVIRDGRYFIRGKPIDETDFLHDPEHPRRSSFVRNLLGDFRSLPVHVCRANDPLPSRGIIVGEAETEYDLRQWAGRRDPSTLPAGGAEFFAAWVQEAGFTPTPRQNGSSAARAAGHELFICGSTSESSREFVLQSRRQRIPVFCLPKSLARGGTFAMSARRRLVRGVKAALRSNPRVVLATGLPLLPDRRRGRKLADYLAQVARAVLSEAEVERVYAEGGATAASLVQRMGWTRLEVQREVAAGVVALRVAGESARLLTVKPGSYPWPNGLGK